MIELREEKNILGDVVKRKQECIEEAGVVRKSRCCKVHTNTSVPQDCANAKSQQMPLP